MTNTAPGNDPDGARKGGAGGSRSGGRTGSAAGTGGASAPMAGGGGPAMGGAPGDGGGQTPIMPTGNPANDAATEVVTDAAAPVAGLALRLTGVATWRGNAAGAYTILHEGVCDPAFIGALNLAEPELSSRGLTASFAIIAQACETGKHWTKLKAMVDKGHDLLNQTLSSGCLGSAAQCGMGVPRAANFANEIDGATTMLMQKVGVGPGVFVFPYDVCTAAATTHLKQKGFLGARCGAGLMNATNFADPFAIKFDLWGPAQSGYKNVPACSAVRPTTTPQQASAACRTHVLNAPVDEAIKSKGWAVRGFHGFTSDMGSYEPVAIADYRAHLDAVKAKVTAGSLWAAGATEVVKYRFARQHCAMPTLNGNVLTFTAPTPDCMKHATNLSYLVSLSDGSDPATLSITQAGKTTPGRKLGPGAFAVDADPTKGDAQIGN